MSEGLLLDGSMKETSNEMLRLEQAELRNIKSSVKQETPQQKAHRINMYTQSHPKHKQKTQKHGHICFAEHHRR